MNSYRIPHTHSDTGNTSILGVYQDSREKAQVYSSDPFSRLISLELACLLLWWMFYQTLYSSFHRVGVIHSQLGQCKNQCSECKDLQQTWPLLLLRAELHTQGSSCPVLWQSHNNLTHGWAQRGPGDWPGSPSWGRAALGRQTLSFRGACSSLSTI